MLQLYRLKERLLDLSYYKDLGCFVTNLLNNKTIILLNLAEYRRILSIRRYSARFRRIIVNYYSFKIFPRFWLVKTTRIIHHNQLLLTKYWANDVKSAARRKLLNQWRQNDIKSPARCRLLNCWQRKPGDEVVLYLVSGKTKSVMAKLL